MSCEGSNLFLNCFRHASNDDLVKDGVVDVNSVINEIAQIKRHQLMLSQDLSKVQLENQLVWQETAQLHEKYQNQQQTVNKILGFLASVFSKKKHVSSNKKRKLLIEDVSESDEEVIKSLDDLIQDPVLVHQTEDENISVNNVISAGQSIFPASASLSPATPNGQSLPIPNSISSQPYMPSSSQPFIASNIPSTIPPFISQQSPIYTPQSTKTPLSHSITEILPELQHDIPGHDPTLPIQEDMEILNDRLDSLSYIMNNYGNLSQNSPKWTHEDLDSANLSILQDTDEGKNLLSQMRASASKCQKADQKLTADSEVSQADFDEFFNDDC